MPTTERLTLAPMGMAERPVSARAEGEIRRSSGDMRILVDNSGYALLNMGDAAMLKVALGRILKRWPTAEVHILTESPGRLADICPHGRALSPDGRATWQRRWNVLGGLQRLVPTRGKPALASAEAHLRNRYPSLIKKWVGRRLARRGFDLAPMDQYLELVASAHAVIATGGGYITDAFKGHAERVLDMLRLAQKLGKPTAMLGQGIGPLVDPQLLSLCRETLPGLELISLRERLIGPALLRALGVRADSIWPTGDDALELAVQEPSANDANGLGVNIRQSDYAGVTEQTTAELGSVFTQLAGQLSAQLVAVPISWYPHESDTLLAARLSMADACGVPASAEHQGVPIGLTLERVRQCRVMVTGSYHAGVFALAHGVPTIGLVKSPYYADKFAGLFHEFGAGTIVDLREPGCGEKLKQRIPELWAQATTMADRLRARARIQVRQSQAAYDRFFDIVERRRGSAAAG